ncbi:aminotransferase [Alcanivorax sp. S71-1-4]|uniref:aminotransferase class I/II-fold pyridoxal phosphate-dependent enzyme n=1 Tax=Alcanivorax sp. S71-1-4 TaxID=1177159 RepID=UPI001357A322|nr:aminotransferase class I/II-fold pyridoxal phosphate-dependent enzyme [Alcanivorax sp. S71-1-4]KAF0808729.1 aminotransferase [Alcanivorax sp. S71-1-4]
MITERFPRAARCDRIAPFHVMALVERAQALAAAGHDVIHLGVGEPDFPTPPAIVEAGRAALSAGQTRYTPAIGIPALREAIAGFYQTRFGVTVSPERIVVTPGASGGLQLLMAAMVGPGDGVLLSDPGYPCNRHFVELVSATPQPLVLSAADGWRIEPAAVAAAWQPHTRVAMFASPDNPTGNVLSGEQVRGLAAVARERNGALIIDEIYQGLVYEQPAETALAVAPEVLVLNSFSKYFGMTGWRLGWVVAPPALVPDLDRMAQNFFLAPSTPAQYAALAAFQPDTLAELERRRQVLAARRAYLLEQLPALGLKVVGSPAGAFYLYLDVSAITDDSYAFSRALLEQAHVALTPGVDFGPGHQPSRYLRVAYTCDLPRLEEALVRLSRFMETL